jgi:hypothetical protein
MHWAAYALVFLALVLFLVLSGKKTKFSSKAIMLEGRHPILGHLKFLGSGAKMLEWV